MKGKVIICLLTIALLSSVPFARAQQAKKVPRIGVVHGTSQTISKLLIDAFRDALRKFGYIEGENIVIEYRWAEGEPSRYSTLMEEMVRLQVDVIVTGGTRLIRTAKEVTRTIPIVAGGGGDLVGAGVVVSLARPGGNVTGTTNIDPDLSAKRLQLLKDAFPNLSRVAVLHFGAPGGDQDELAETRAAGRALKIQVQNLEVKNSSQFQNAYLEMKMKRADALIIFHSTDTFFHQRQLLDLAAKNRMPTMAGRPDWADDGCLISYGPDRLEGWRRAAYFVDKILKGAKPADLPVHQPTKFELVINLKTAKQIGITVPQSVLYRADKVIK